MGKFIAVMPAAIIAMLLVSLVEASIALPGHLSHDAVKPRTFFQWVKYRLSQSIAPLERLFEWVGNKETLVPELLAKYPSLRFRWEGQQQETAESFSSLVIGFTIAMLAMYLLLVFEFSSYLQPFIILAIVPFGMVGAIFGHAFMGLPLTLFSMFGMVTLAGVVVNDSIVLVDFINQCIRGGMPVNEALMTAGSRRLRAVFLTSVTTIAGLLPMLSEKSLQAQALIPMATSLAFGLLASTCLVLLMVPFLYRVYAVLTFTKEQMLGLEPIGHGDVTGPDQAREPAGGLAPIA